MPHLHARGGVVASWLLLVASLSTPAFAISAANDPSGDTFGNPNVAHDLSRMDSGVTGEYMLILLEFHDSIEPPSAFAPESVVGYVDIDVDQNPLTGAPSNSGRFIPGGDASLGIEFYVDLFSERFQPGKVDVIDASTMQPIGMADATYSPSGFNVAIPLGLLGGDALINYGVIVGDFLDMSDAAESVVIPEPSGIALTIAGCLLGAAKRRARNRCV